MSASLLSKLKAHSLEEHIQYWLPVLHRLVKRVRVFRHTEQKKYYFQWLRWILTNHHLEKDGFSLSNYGVWLAIRPNDATYQFALDASYNNTLEGILARISKETTFLDIGSNIGIFSLVAENNKNIKVIHCFEPDPVSFNFLKRNIKRNEAQKIIAHNVAIGLRAGTASLSVTEGHSGVSHIINNSNERDHNLSRSIQMIDQIELDKMLQSSPAEYFIKIDVEGYELQVLQVLARSHFFYEVNKIFLEFDSNFDKVQEVERFLIENDFREAGRWGSATHWDALWEKPKA